MIKKLRLLLLPFSLIYGMVTLVRNKFYDWGLFRSVKFNLPVICVGNLVVGGSGKTPVTEYLVQLLDDYKIAILSRGYGRKTKGFILADGAATAESIGDEPMQFYRKFSNITVAVCEDRVKGIELLKEHHDLIILDDAFQHRRVRAGFNILLFEYQKLLRPQFLLPAGNLREFFFGYQRAESLLITKIPVHLDIEGKKKVLKKFKKGNIPAFSEIKYAALEPVYGESGKQKVSLIKNMKVFLLTGIANPEPMISYLSGCGVDVDHHHYADHHQFSLSEIQRLVRAFEKERDKEKIIITTEKDAQRLSDIRIKELLLNLPVFYLPIRIEIQKEDKVTFDQNILNYVSSHTRNR
ncbi:tetraacyldisaccharide 4'-kinase [Pedobacter sp. HMWF019]|uniref:tetraacyldisaccharide 4'-kinase n=1 Tax=Pedobacter sp. HMWF019 TaxID=2056856 RepID=UPI000D343D50|nr:tetraacyldisaccharide 4'-kinase [Pedobacter sp. HMWF019]PTT02937.1 tetraacyldisaccharide 4'-kinase [Pedobacter sp. HMWF019]